MNYAKDLSFPTQFRPFTDVLGRFLGEMDPYNGGTAVKRAVPRVNILEDDKHFKLEVQVPGFSKEQLKLNLEKEVLTISAEREQEDRNEIGRYTRREFSSHAFSRSFRLPELIDADGIRADHVDGVLTVLLPKKAEAKPAAKQIQIA